MNGLDVGRRLGIVAKRLAQKTHGLGQGRIGDERLLPDCVDDFLTRHDVAGARQQQLEDAEHAGRQWYLRPFAPQKAPVRVELERPERHRRRSRRRRWHRRQRLR